MEKFVTIKYQLRHQLAAFVLLIALCSPILIKTQHFLFPNHQHCSHCNPSTSLQHKCEIQDFDYFFFIAEKKIILEACEKIINRREKIEYVSRNEDKYLKSYHLRAPPVFIF